MIKLYIIAGLMAYLLGSIPFGYLLVRIFRGQDIRLSGSGNIGATNVVRSGAKGLGIATLVLDALKGSLAVGLASWFAASKYNDCGDFVAFHCVNTLPFLSTAALFAVLGHMFPVWLKFKGGKGVATALGVFCVLFPKAVLVSLAIFILVVAITRFVSLGSILAAIFFPIAAYFLLKPDAVSLTLSSLIALLVVLKHHQNISRLLAGTENRFGRSKSPIAEKTL
ncbi:MAG TPA: glycerol-3-phosphate 1-O-acyltransferase PlsY [Candidatus Angelobacter sp.]|nr:glycerol-3-phosphate 1-O-acyltransferase PlsY [Candidatus Angelobacter sp.]